MALPILSTEKCDIPTSKKRKWRLANALRRLAVILVKDNAKMKPGNSLQLKHIHEKIKDKHSELDVLDGIYYTLSFMQELINKYPANNDDAVKMAEACIQTYAHNDLSYVFKGLNAVDAIHKINMVQMNQNKLVFNERS